MTGIGFGVYLRGVKPNCAVWAAFAHFSAKVRAGCEPDCDVSDEEVIELSIPIFEFKNFINYY
jgi:hypothetical protein